MKISSETIEAVKAVTVLDLVYRLGAQVKKVGIHYQVFCPNPNHVEKTPDTYIRPSINRFQCFGGGGCGAAGDAIAFYAWYTFGYYDPKAHFLDCVTGIAEVMGIPVQYEDKSRPQKPRKRPTATPAQKFEYVSAGDVEARSADECDRIYRKFLSMCPIYRRHAEEWLGPKRQYSKEDVIAMGLRSVPGTYEEVSAIIKKLLQSGESLERVPGFTQRLRKGGDPENKNDWYWTIVGKIDENEGGYFIPVRDEEGRIVRLRVTTNGKPKYIWFSSAPNVFLKDGKWTFDDPQWQAQRDNYLHKMRKGGAPSGAPVNVVLPIKQLTYWSAGTPIDSIVKMDVVVGTEGEHKGQISSNRLNLPFICVPGVGNYRDVVPLLQKWRVKKFCIAYDMDFLKNKRVFQHLVAFAKECLILGIEVVIWTWNIKDGKGLDDLLLSNKLPIEIDLRTREQRPVTLSA
ncbi:CHC2 zinc finger domain-containing protein [Aneurinibacillus thermoaerophilus]|uniref:CHC2 zinc finger domain-containing protein n=1 Tax=Aneurinibacillus thermoaerophilus TaxID=143495 RepID=UPI002E1A0B9D|nr:CHC2 zinc finger domain-containing protein [Aneurinibacillus thermoaerophilus]MED0677519.1 CHC2 zinc finger domain-containing protein [Aneurinibacillus thermoaerophilus]